jgi:oxygen-independent coproporphyrinogen III oxidase
MRWTALADAGFVQYEISNWARRGPSGALLTCRHNLQYWYNQPYLGFGAGAHGYAAGSRTMNIGGIKPFVERCHAEKTALFPAGPAARRIIAVGQRMEMQETMMVGLRLTEEGVSASRFASRFGQSLEAVFPQKSISS